MLRTQTFYNIPQCYSVKLGLLVASWLVWGRPSLHSIRAARFSGSRFTYVEGKPHLYVIPAARASYADLCGMFSVLPGLLCLFGFCLSGLFICFFQVTSLI